MSEGPRLAPTTDQDWDDDTRELLDGLGRLNIFTTLAHHPKLLKRWLVFGNHVLAKSSLAARTRELAILRTGWRCGSEYEFGQHTVIGRRSGLDDAEVRRLTEASLEGWSRDDALVLQAVDELVAVHRLGDDTWSSLAERWTTEQVLDLIFTVGQYTLVSTALNSLGVERDEGVPGWPT